MAAEDYYDLDGPDSDDHLPVGLDDELWGFLGPPPRTVKRPTTARKKRGEHFPVGEYLPVGQLDGDCSCGRGSYPCPDTPNNEEKIMAEDMATEVDVDAVKGLRKALSKKVADRFKTGDVIRWTGSEKYTYAVIKDGRGKWTITADTALFYGARSFTFDELLKILNRADTSNIGVATAWDDLA